MPAGEEMESSVADENDFGKGGGNQFRILGKAIERWFKNPRAIQTTLPDVLPGESTLRGGAKAPVDELPTLPEGDIIPEIIP